MLTAFFKFDYGKKNRGVSLEKESIFPAIKDVFNIVVPFWLEDNGYPESLDELQELLLLKVHIEKPDFVFFVLKNEEIKNETIDKINKISKTINWFCDDQWRFESFSKNKAIHLSYILTVDKFSLLKYKQLGCSNVFHTQWGVKEVSEKHENEYKYDISFIGSKNIIREWYVNELKKRGFIVNCFGFGWENGKVSYNSMIEIFQLTRINLNISNSYNFDLRFVLFFSKKIFFEIFKSIIKLRFDHIKRIVKKYRKIYRKRSEQIKARIFEIPASGGFLLTQYTPEIEDYYIIGKDIAIFTTIDDLCIQLDYFLQNVALIDDYAYNAYMKTKQYTYVERMQEIRKWLNSSFSNE